MKLYASYNSGALAQHYSEVFSYYHGAKEIELFSHGQNIILRFVVESEKEARFILSTYKEVKVSRAK